MARVINYLPKFTAARTEYRELAQDDHNWLVQEIMHWAIHMAALSNTTNSDFKLVRDQYWRKRRSDLPKGRDGQNTPESMIAGILDNMLYSDTPQRDFTQRQCEAIENISNWMNAIDDRFQEIRFQIRIV